MPDFCDLGNLNFLYKLFSLAACAVNLLGFTALCYFIILAYFLNMSGELNKQKFIEVLDQLLVFFFHREELPHQILPQKL